MRSRFSHFLQHGFGQVTDTCPATRLSGVRKEIRFLSLYNFHMFVLKALLATLLLTQFVAAQEHVSFPTEDGGVVYADIYGKGERGCTKKCGLGRARPIELRHRRLLVRMTTLTVLHWIMAICRS